MAEIRVKETGTIKLFESDNTSSVTIASPASLGADRTITLPDADVTLVSGTMSTGFVATDITGQSDYGNISPATGDSMVFYDTSAGALKEITMANLGNTPAWHAHAAGTQSIANTTDTFITYGTTLLDTHSAFDGTNKWTCPADCGGQYLVGAILNMAMADGSRYALNLRKNGSSGMAEAIPQAGSAADLGGVVTAIVYLGATDYIQVRTWQNSGGATNAAGNLQNNQFWGFRITGT